MANVHAEMLHDVIVRAAEFTRAAATLADTPGARADAQALAVQLEAVGAVLAEHAELRIQPQGLVRFNEGLITALALLRTGHPELLGSLPDMHGPQKGVH